MTNSNGNFNVKATPARPKARPADCVETPTSNLGKKSKSESKTEEWVAISDTCWVDVSRIKYMLYEPKKF